MVIDPRSQDRPNLTALAVPVSDSRPAAGAAFTLSATVRNDGDGESAATTLRYYRSADATITTADTEVGTEPVPTLAASGTSAQSIVLRAPATAGSYYYGACVDMVTDESDTADNCSAAVRINVRETQPQPTRHPNLEVGTPTLSDSSLETGATFTLSATVSNTGNGAAPATTLRYYRSADATITTADTEVGTDRVPTLAASGTSAQSIVLTAPATAGSHYYGACVDTVADESDTADNCSAAARINVRETQPLPTGHPNLEVGTPTVSDSSLETGAAFTLSVAVSNTGNGAATATTLRYYRSADAIITTTDTEVGTRPVVTLAASGTSAQSIVLTAPATAGSHYYGACVDTVADESDTADNCSAAARINVQETQPLPTGHPNLEVGTPTVSDSSPEPGAAFTLSATVSNTGNGAATATTLRYYRSADAIITAADTEVGTRPVVTLAASGTSAQSVELTAPATAGSYYYGACVDTVTDESDAADNCSAPVAVDVEEPERSDLEVGTPTVSDTSPETGAAFTLSATVSNTGNGVAPATTLRYYRSADATITRADTEVGTDAVAMLAASGTSAQSVELTAPATAGAYYYGACVDTVADESDTADNCSPAVQVDVQEAPPQPVGPPNLEVGTPTLTDGTPGSGTFTLSVTVNNTGDSEAPATTLRYYRSEDETITTVDTEVGTDAVATLAASATSAQSIVLTATAGEFYYGACVDPVADESDTADNCSPPAKAGK